MGSRHHYVMIPESRTYTRDDAVAAINGTLDILHNLNPERFSWWGYYPNPWSELEPDRIPEFHPAYVAGQTQITPDMVRPSTVRNIRWEFNVLQEDTGASVYFSFTSADTLPSIELIIPVDFLSVDQERRMLVDLKALHDPIAISPPRSDPR